MCAAHCPSGCCVCIRIHARSALQLVDGVKFTVQASFRYGDSDTPEGTWVAGEHGELFEYKLLGVHKVISGWSSVMHCPGSAHGSELPSIPDHAKAQLREALSSGADTAWRPSEGPLLFAGELVDCETASVYLHREGSSLLISSNHEGF